MSMVLSIPVCFESTDRPISVDAPAASRLFEVDQEKRTIYGLAVPFGTPTFAANWEGQRFVFQRGSLEYPEDLTRIKLLISHSRHEAVGKLIEVEETDEGSWQKFSVASTPEGDHALQMAADGVWDGLSIGLRDGAKYEIDEDTGLTTFLSAVLAETSLTPDPAFADARVSTVKAEAPTQTTRKAGSMPCTICGQVHAEGVTCSAPPTFAAPASLTLADESIAALGAQIGQAFGAAFAQHMPAAATGPQLVDPTTFESEPSPYAFDAGAGTFGVGENDFSSDIFAAYGGDKEAGNRALEFIQRQFAVSSANVAAANPDGYRPDLAVTRRDYSYPLWSTVEKGSLTDGTPFKFPVFSSATNLVADHAQGVSPADGTFVLASKTVTPTPMSGRIQIPREVMDAGGNPQVSGWIWSLMVQAYDEAKESAVAATLLAEAANIADIALPAGDAAGGAGVDGGLVSAILAKFADLQYVRGGFRFSVLGTQIGLYRALASAKDGAGRQILPYIAPSNASGSARARLGSLDLLGVEAVPCWALAPDSANSENSWLIDPAAVHGWATPPKRLDFEYRTEYLDLAIWGYRAVVVADPTGVRQVTYDRGV